MNAMARWTDPRPLALSLSKGERSPFDKLRVSGPCFDTSWKRPGMRAGGSSSKRGYTLLEVLIGLAIFTVVVVPLLTTVFDRTRVTRSRDTVIASCLLQQEAAIITAFPDQIVPFHKRRVDGTDWTISVTVAGTGMAQCILQALKAGTAYGRTIVYVFKEGQ
jgi:prepilin-type N-terminal cleavage/methylation domain-containing protein